MSRLIHLNATRIAGLLCLAVLMMIAFGGAEALAQQTQTSGTFGAAQKSVANQIVTFPKMLALAAYIMGAFFALTGLLKLKDWMGDSERNTLIAAVFRFIVASLLIYLPYGIMVMNTSLFGSDGGGNSMGTNNIKAPPPKLNPFK